MQSVVRSSFIGLLAVAGLTAGLTACGDKTTVTGTATDTTIHGVTVTPASVPNLAVGGTFTLAASVDAGPGAKDRTVTWSSSDATIASVDAASGKVTGVKAGGPVTITAASKQDANVKGAAVVTVGGAGTGPVVQIQQINQGGGIVPVNIANVQNQIDVLLNVDAGGNALKTITATVKCGNDSVSQTQTFASGNVAALDADAAAASLQVFSFNTAAFTVNSNGSVTVPLHNGQCTVTAVATTAGNQVASSTQSFTLNNQDGVIIANSFAPITNAEGVTTVTTATDAGGLPWRGGSVTVVATPVLYNAGRTISSVAITLPGATNATQTLTAAPYSATWSASASSGPRVTGLTLVGGGLEANGTTPTGITPTVVVLDAAGNDLSLNVLNAGVINQTTFRLDNTAPEAPATFITPGRQLGWVNGSYVFTGAGGASYGATGTTNFVACGDGPIVGGTPGCSAQVGVATLGGNGSTVTSTSGNGASGVTGLTTFTYYYISAASYAAASATNGTSTSANACSTTGWTKFATGNDIPVSANNLAYVVRVFETDKLGNSRCTDLSSAAAVNGINNGAFANGKFGVDKVAPTASFVAAGDPSCGLGGCIQDQAKITANPVGFFQVGYSDDLSGFNTTPLTTKLTRLAIDPATNAAASVNSAFGCPIGFSANSGTCGTAAAAGTISADNASGIDGYYTYTSTIMDVARNVGNTLTRTVVVDRVAPTMGGIAVPATITGGQPASFATSAVDNLDLVSTDYTLSYAITPAGAATALDIRANGAPIGVAFDNVLTTAASFSLSVPSFIRNVASTNAGGVPQNNGVLPSQIAVRVYDAAGNASAPGVAVINPANVSTPPIGPAITNYSAAQSNGAVFTGSGFQVSNAVANVSNCPATGSCTPANPTTVTLSATAQGTEGLAFQFLNPFTSVQFYYLDAGYVGATNQWILIGSATAPTVTDNAGQTVRTFTWTLGTAFDPPAALGAAPLNIIAVGVNSLGDALVSAQNANITLTNP
jgi:hypothetical protein